MYTFDRKGLRSNPPLSPLSSIFTINNNIQLVDFNHQRTSNYCFYIKKKCFGNAGQNILKLKEQI